MYDRIKKIELVARRDATIRAAERYEIFVAGPFIDVAKGRDHPDNTSTLGKIVRYAVRDHYISEGHNIYLGEDVELRDLGEKHYGALSNATFFERHYINSNIDALIVFPDGPGVFCELGDWATTPSTCRKMLVVIRKEFQGEPNYINDGTAKAAAHHGATVVYVPYDDEAAIISECDKFIDRLAAASRVDKLYAR